MAAADPPHPVEIAPPNHGTVDDAVVWAARSTCGGEEPYSPPKIRGWLATIEMAPNVVTPAAPGYMWYPAEGFSRRGLRTYRMRKISIAVWRANVWNTWREHYRYYCVGAWVAWFVALTVGGSGPQRGTSAEQVLMAALEYLLLSSPSIGLAIMALVASKGIRYVTPAKAFAVLAILFNLLWLAVAMSAISNVSKYIG